ncbi:hypothetical protein [Gloeothece verrucosa]|uniref:Uncharacterized protein n=1 Tax=Gloeothece verrucosa (strain PCC 7822) TaxID=497965 RepID=E0UM24_GLOV7|nr:hypothetical protein [Gloeothece verrucosa]ADN18004.1 conserved hypothetical protein [Gloeothece verrucosa PCC 7822]
MTRLTQYEDFDILELENSIEKAYNAQNTAYCDREIQLDKSENDYGLYHVWYGRQCLGTFCRSFDDDCWLATPFYRNGCFADSFTPPAFETHQQAQDYLD